MISAVTINTSLSTLIRLSPVNNPTRIPNDEYCFDNSLNFSLDNDLIGVVYITLFFFLKVWIIAYSPTFVFPDDVGATTKTFLFLMGFGPLIMTILLSAIFGMKLRAGWGQHSAGSVQRPWLFRG